MSVVKLIHVPKTGGTTASNSPLIQSLNHIAITDKPGQLNPVYIGPRSKNVTATLESLKSCKVIGITRNIYSWLVSYAGFAGCFNTGHRRHYDYPHAKKGFDYLVKVIMNREEPWPSRRFIFTQFWTVPSGLWLLDHVFHTEQLDKELKEYFPDYKPPSRKQVGQHKPYRSYYGDTLIEAIRKTWQREFRLFGYDWEHTESQGGLLNGAIGNKSLVSYCYKTDVCLVKGQVFNPV